jgi:hypothetical protein
VLFHTRLDIMANICLAHYLMQLQTIAPLPTLNVKRCTCPPFLFQLLRMLRM